MTPDSPTCADANNGCDCSGYVLWCYSLPRENSDGTWNNTDAIYNDAMGSQVRFVRIDTPIVGAMMVFPGGRDGPYGHIGIIAEVKNGQVTKVIHCSAAADIAITTPEVFFANGAIMVKARNTYYNR